MNNDIYLIGEIGKTVNLKTVMDSVNNSDKSKPLNFHIHSEGGSVYDGIAIYKYLKGLDQEVNTFSAGLVASIATIIFLAGKKETRTVTQGDKFLIHLPRNAAKGTADEIDKVVNELRIVENQLSGIYELETGISKEDVSAKMKDEDFVSTDWLKENGFVNDIIEFKAVAKLTKTKIKSKNKMKKNLSKEDKSWFTQMFNKHFAQPTNKIVVDANDVEIDFTDVEEDATPVVGDKATVDGAPADGSYVMPSEDDMMNGQTFVFVAGELTEIVEPKTEGDDTEALKKENEDLKAEISTLKAENKTSTDNLVDMKNDLKEMKNKIETSFEWDGKKVRTEEKGKGRSFTPNNK